MWTRADPPTAEAKTAHLGVATGRRGANRRPRVHGCRGIRLAATGTVPLKLATRFWRQTPVTPPGQDHAPTALAEPAGAPVILVVDDTPAVRRLVVRYVQGGAREILEASNGEEAIAVAEEFGKPIDLLITDIRMPVMDGQTLVETLHQRRPDMKVLFLSGYSETLFEQRPLLPPWAAYLDKPILRDSLYEAVSLLLYGTTKRFAGASVHTLPASETPVGQVP